MVDEYTLNNKYMKHGRLLQPPIFEDGRQDYRSCRNALLPLLQRESLTKNKHLSWMKICFISFFYNELNVTFNNKYKCLLATYTLNGFWIDGYTFGYQHSTNNIFNWLSCCKLREWRRELITRKRKRKGERGRERERARD